MSYGLCMAKPEPAAEITRSSPRVPTLCGFLVCILRVSPVTFSRVRLARGAGPETFDSVPRRDLPRADYVVACTTAATIIVIVKTWCRRPRPSTRWREKSPRVKVTRGGREGRCTYYDDTDTRAARAEWHIFRVRARVCVGEFTGFFFRKNRT